MYDYVELIEHFPELSKHVKDGELDYSCPEAVRVLNRALLKKEYNLTINLPEGHLCPTVPNRSQYIYQIESMLKTLVSKQTAPITGIDIGTGVTCVYPLIGCARNPNWTFLATEIDDEIISYARENCERNSEIIGDRVTLIKNEDAAVIFPQSLFDHLSSSPAIKFVMCNPPFYTGSDDLESRRAFKRHKPVSGQWEMKETELGTKLGGEIGFIKKMIDESRKLYEFDNNVILFSCMLGMKESLLELLEYLKQSNSNHLIRFAYDLLQIKHTCRYLLFWSFSQEFPKDSGNRLKMTAKVQRVQSIQVANDFNFQEFLEIISSKYGSVDSNALLLTHNKWSRKYRRSPESAPLLNNPIKMSIVYENDLVSFYPEEGADWETFLGFVNHLRKDEMFNAESK